MDPALTQAIEALAGRLAVAAAERLIDHARHDETLRGQLVDAARTLLAELEADEGSPALTLPAATAEAATTADLEPDAEAPAATEAQPEESPAAEEVATDGHDPAPAAATTPPASAATADNGPLPALTLGQSVPAAEGPRWSASPEVMAQVAAQQSQDAALAKLEARSRLKADALLWAADPKRRRSNGERLHRVIEPREQELLEQADALDSALWMLEPSFVVPADARLIDECTSSFQGVADSASLVRRLLSQADVDRRSFQAALALLAETQSALRVAVERLGRSASDPDQLSAYMWLRGETARRQIYLSRFMRINDPADPGALGDLRDRIRLIDTNHRTLGLRDKKQRKLLGTLRYHAGRVAQGDGTEHDWNKVVATIDGLLEAGMPPSAREIRELVLPLTDHMPDLDPVPRGLRLVLQAIDQYLATQAAEAERRCDDTSAAEEESATPAVAEVARYLEGREVILIGGNRRVGAAEALESAFRLSRLEWLETREHESIDWFEPHVARPSVALVLLAIRWSSHSFGEVKGFCDLYGKPLVRLPGGYNPNQVAAQILEQAAQQLVRPGEDSQT